MKLFQKNFLKPPLLAGLKLGDAGEQWATYLYQKSGHKILARNFAVFDTKKLGELDIVCRKGKRIVIVEVKTRADESFMPLEEAVHPRKQYLLRRMAHIFLRQNPKYQKYDIQIDIAGILMDPVDNFVRSVKLIENAIEDTV